MQDLTMGAAEADEGVEMKIPKPTQRITVKAGKTTLRF